MIAGARWTICILFCCATLVGSGSAAQPLPGTKALEEKGDLARRMVDGIDRYLSKKLAASAAQRESKWRRDFSSPEKYSASVAPNRARLAKIIGALDAREPVTALEFVATTSQPALIGETDDYEILAVRWPSVRSVRGEGLLLRPKHAAAVACVVAVPDADQTPEMLVGLTPGVAPESQFARRLAESGCLVLVPALIDRGMTYSATMCGQRRVDLSHREFLYRPAYEMGRHIIGYETQKILAAVDWFSQQSTGKDPVIGVMGYGEGGLLALYAAALDPRIDAACVSGYFDARERVWQEPIYRNVFGLLDEFGDAEVASLIAPRALIVEACTSPEIPYIPVTLVVDKKSAAAPGELATPKLETVRAEFNRANHLLRGLPDRSLSLVVTKTDDEENGRGPFGSQGALEGFLDALDTDKTGVKLSPAAEAPKPLVKSFNVQPRLKRQFEEIVEDTQALMRESEYTRDAFWAKADRKSRSVDAWQSSAAWYRNYFHNEVIGRCDDKLLPENARTRKIFDEPKYAGYEVVLDVFPDVIASGILLLPKDLTPGERRPVVVCQHGLEGRPRDVADPSIDSPFYHRYGCRLADEGFIVYAPQNPYLFRTDFRQLQRKANPLKRSLFSMIVAQHDQLLRWLGSQPQVDAKRIALYGLSYGGKTAMRVPAILEGYCLSICSADFNEWIWKNVSTRAQYTFVHTGEYEMFEFDLGNTFNYAEMAGLIAPRPFMVERGHRDGVAPDPWVAYEFAKVRLLYADLKIPDRAEIEFFDGPHSINGVGTFEFLRKHLGWPEK